MERMLTTQEEKMLTPGMGQIKRQERKTHTIDGNMSWFLNCLPQPGQKGKAYPVSYWSACETEH